MDVKVTMSILSMGIFILLRSLLKMPDVSTVYFRDGAC